MGVKEINKLTLEDIKPITISFKKTAEELELYKWILSHSGYSSFIKDKLNEVKDNEQHTHSIPRSFEEVGVYQNPNVIELSEQKEEKVKKPLIDLDF